MTHSILENKELRCRNISVSQPQFQGGLVGSCLSDFPSLVNHPLWVIVVAEHPMVRCSISLARISGSEQTFSARSIRALTTALLAEIVWLELKSRYPSMCVVFLYTETDYSLPLGFREQCPRKECPPPHFGCSMVNFMCGLHGV